MIYAKMSSLDPGGGFYAYARRCFGPFFGLSNSERAVLAGMLDR